jgi:hypothetical protein
MRTENLNAGSSPGEGSQAGLFAQPAAGTEANDYHAAPEEEAESRTEYAEEAVEPAAAASDTAAHEAPSAAAEDGHEGDAAGEATAAAQLAVDARAGSGHHAAAGPQPAAPLSPTTRILPDEDEPYVFNDCTVTINIQLLPDDGDADGREVIIAVSSHIEGPLVELTRLRLLGELPPPVAELVRLHEGRLPALGEARAEQRQRETTAKASGAKSKTTVRGSNGKATTGAKSSSASGAGATPTGPVTPVTGEQTALFDLMTGHRPKADEGSAGGEGTAAEEADASAETPAAAGGE